MSDWQQLQNKSALITFGERGASAASLLLFREFGEYLITTARKKLRKIPETMFATASRGRRFSSFWKDSVLVAALSLLGASATAITITHMNTAAESSGLMGSICRSKSTP
ncbi:MAG: hypothetical protein CTY31_13580 [Hyphomicrobium sp.]|nr:MAG: hypothetical protein CTY39_01795 [Hyphomicrobium sp.]PPC98307.1 MAG: hypothetical protein CTY31_13580 [Hyphomicrobium sp.]